jgi:hypothetical protein
MAETEKARRMSASAFEEAAQEAQKKMTIELVKEEVQGELSRRLSLDAAFQTAEVCARKFASVEEAKDVDVEDPGFSQLYKAISDQLDFYFEEAERIENRNLAIESQVMEKIRREAEALNEEAREELLRSFVTKNVVQATEEERFRRMGEESAYDAAEMAASLLNKRLSSTLSEMERSRRLSFEAKDEEILAHDLAKLFEQGFLKKLRDSSAAKAAEIGERRNSKATSIEAAEVERSRRMSEGAAQGEELLSMQLASLFMEGYRRKISAQAFGEAASVGLDKAAKFEHMERVANVFREANFQ